MLITGSSTSNIFSYGYVNRAEQDAPLLKTSDSDSKLPLSSVEIDKNLEIVFDIKLLFCIITLNLGRDSVLVIYFLT